MAVYDIRWDVGAHTGFSGKICDTLWTSVNYGMMVTQFFLGSPQSAKRCVVSEQDIIECKKILKRWPMHVFTHFPYLCNLAGSVGTLAWSGDSLQDKKTYMWVKGLEYELGVVAKVTGELGDTYKSGVVVHPGSFPDKIVGLKNVAKTINKINFPENSFLVLENSAGQGSTFPSTFQEFKVIFDAIDQNQQEHVKVCVDTCHLFAKGDYDIRKTEEIDRMFADIETYIGLKRVSLLHLNDSCIPLGGKKDKHACLGCGHIWEKSMDSLVYLLDKCKTHKIPKMLETHGLDMITLSLL